MKQAYTKLLTFAIILASAFSLQSCMDRDTEKSIVLSGEWRGDFGMNYTEEYRGHLYTYASYDTYLTFTPDYGYATHGYGTQVDYYAYGPYEYMYYQFDWEIRNDLIYLSYRGNHQLDACICQYRITDNRFSGIFQETGTTFSLNKLVDYYDWTPYRYETGYYSRPGWTYPMYERTRSEAADSTQAQSDTTPIAVAHFDEEHKIVSWGKR